MFNFTEFLKTLFKSIFAGIAIGFAGFIYTGAKWCASYITSYYKLTDKYDLTELGNIVGSALFSIGLFIVCSLELSLLTGKFGLMFESYHEYDYYLGLILMLLFNLPSAYGFGYLINYLINLSHSDKSNLYVLLSTNISKNKSTLNSMNDYIKIFVQSMFCGVCVHIAVKCFKIFSSMGMKSSGLILLVWFVFMFVYSGFQHCVANCFYFGQANMFNVKAIISACISVVGNWIGTLPISILTKRFNKLNSSFSPSLSSSPISPSSTSSESLNNEEI